MSAETVPSRERRPMTSTTPRQRIRLIIGGIFLTLLLAAVFTLGSLDAPFQPRTWRDVITLYAVSSFITALLLVFALILTRTIARLLLRSEEHTSELQSPMYL